jgi:hypothetical protein
VHWGNVVRVGKRYIVAAFVAMPEVPKDSQIEDELLSESERLRPNIHLHTFGY